MVQDILTISIIQHISFDIQKSLESRKNDSEARSIVKKENSRVLDLTIRLYVAILQLI